MKFYRLRYTACDMNPWGAWTGTDLLVTFNATNIEEARRMATEILEEAHTFMPEVIFIFGDLTED